MQQLLEKKLTLELAPEVLDVINESSKHNVPKDSESHFKATIVSSAFTSLSKVARHRLVFSLLTNEVKSIHALSLALFTPKEWQTKTNYSHNTPLCAKKP